MTVPSSAQDATPTLAVICKALHQGGRGEGYLDWTNLSDKACRDLLHEMLTPIHHSWVPQLINRLFTLSKAPETLPECERLGRLIQNQLQETYPKHWLLATLPKSSDPNVSEEPNTTAPKPKDELRLALLSEDWTTAMALWHQRQVSPHVCASLLAPLAAGGTPYAMARWLNVLLASQVLNPDFLEKAQIAAIKADRLDQLTQLLELPGFALRYAAFKQALLHDQPDAARLFMAREDFNPHAILAQFNNIAAQRAAAHHGRTGDDYQQAMDRLGCLSPPELQVTWLAKYPPDYLPQTAAMHQAHVREQRLQQVAAATSTRQRLRG